MAVHSAVRCSGGSASTPQRRNLLLCGELLRGVHTHDWQEELDVEMCLWDRQDYRDLFREAMVGRYRTWGTLLTVGVAP